MDSCDADPGYGGYKNGVIACAGAASSSADAPRVPKMIPQRRMAVKRFFMERVTNRFPTVRGDLSMPSVNIFVE